MKIFRALLLLIPVCFYSAPAICGSHSNFDIKSLEKMAVQSGGRIKPFSSFSKEVVLYVTGKERFAGKDANTLLLEWIAKPEQWEAQPLIPVSNQALRTFLGIPAETKRVSPHFLSSSRVFLDSVAQIDAKQSQGEVLSTVDKAEIELYQKMSLFYASCEGKNWSVIPNPSSPHDKWLSIDMIKTDQRIGSLAVPLNTMLESYRSNDPVKFKQASEEFINRLGLQNSFTLEIQYNHLRPFGWAWHLYLLGFLIFLINFVLKKSFLSWIGVGSVILGFLLHTYGFVLRCIISGRPPVSNMYESVIWVSWAAVLFAVILFFVYRSTYVTLAASAIAAVGLILADSLPAVLDPSISPLEPVLRNNFWLTIHVLTITLSYGAFALALAIAHISLLMHVFQTKNENLLRIITEFLYRALQIGVVLLAAGTILGGVWANYSWGRFWGWDPKETWALIALLGYLAILHCRYVGWIGPFGLAVGASVAFLGVLMAWYGVNFVLAAGLHSYGFAGGGLPYVGAFVIADLLLVALLSFVYWKKTQIKTSH
ncbi:MAG: cytochrome c biogenesis protein CcsA [Candidatus Omnitrophica bacterium]|nr:cytochrome c biogenesis protein CcsA [Candidatus Omnitrophota bacterium]